jgi:hypothetical protein
MTALREEPLTAPIRFALHLVSSGDGTTSGTFVTTGLVGDSGTLPALARFAALHEDVRLPLVVHGAESLSGTEGAIAVSYDGVFHPAAPGVFSGAGLWRVTGGDHAYEDLRGEGTWRATAVFGGTLVVDAVYEGRGWFA